MEKTGKRGRVPRTVALVAVLFGVVSMLAVVPVPSAPVQAANVAIGTIQGQMANQLGKDHGTSGNCITYAPPGTSTSSTLVSSPAEAQTGHGYKNSCPSSLSTATQSVVGFRPSATTSVQDGQQFLIGRMIHYNNPITANDRYFTGTMNVVLSGFAAPNTLAFPWQLDETPNTGGGGCCNDLITFTNQISNVTLTQGGLTFRLVIKGFVPVDDAASCPAQATGQPVNEFSTVEGDQTHACLYASVVQLRSLTIVKQITAGSPSRSFNFTSSSSLAGSPWANGKFDLGGGVSTTKDLTSGESVTVTETDPNDDRWALTGLTCTQIGTGGLPEPIPGATINLAARQAVLANVPPPPTVANPGITCTYTNTYTPKATITLVKQVVGGGALPSLWTLTATGSAAPPPAGTQVSGPSGSPAVTAQRVPAGSYALTETGTGAAATGWVQQGEWACVTGAGTTLTVTNGNVTLPDNAPTSTNGAVTCTIANRRAVGSLQVKKVVDAPAGAYTGGPAKAFTGTYNCGPGATGAYSATPATPAVITNLPAGSLCSVAENPPSGGLANASYAWGTPTYSTQPVTIADQQTSAITITNPVAQRFGTFALTKVVDGPGGYTGGTGRTFPVDYSCALTNGPTTAGTVQVTTSQSVSPANQIPTGSVCSFTETLTTQPGDFIDPSYVWAGSSLSPASVTIGDGTTVGVTPTNTYTRQFGSLQIAKVVSGGGYLGGTTPNFTDRVLLRTRLRGHRDHRRRWQRDDPGPAGRHCLHRAGAATESDAVEPGVRLGHADLGAGADRRPTGQRHSDADGDQPNAADLRSGRGHQSRHG